MLWAAFDLDLLLCAVKVKALRLQDAVQPLSRLISHVVLCASCSSIELLSLPCAFPIKRSWKFNCFWEAKQNSMFGIDTVRRWQSQSWNGSPPPPDPISKFHFYGSLHKIKELEPSWSQG